MSVCRSKYNVLDVLSCGICPTLFPNSSKYSPMSCGRVSRVGGCAISSQQAPNCSYVNYQQVRNAVQFCCIQINCCIVAH